MQKLLSIEDVSDYLSISVNTLYKWRTNGYGPIGRRMGKHVRYKPEDVEAWVDEQGRA